MSSKIQIYAPAESEALRYTLEFIFDEFFGVSWDLVSDQSRLVEGQTFLNYSDQKMPGGIQILPYGNFDRIEFPFKANAKEGKWNNLPVFFTTPGEIPFDVFAAVFFLISRYEEYHISDRDEHGRFQAQNALAHKLNLLDRPIVDEWLRELGKFLKSKLTHFSPVIRKFEWFNTFDIDVAYAYKNRPVTRVLGATGKNVIQANFHLVSERAKVLFGSLTDPYDTYALQEEIARKYGCKTLYFFLVGGKTPFDNALDIKQKGIRKLISRVRAFASVGLHPSYDAGTDIEILNREKSALQNATNFNVDASRQHFLRLDIPSTYENLIRADIKSDYTMGYAERIGFRSGTCTPHFFFNIQSGRKTQLKLYPLHIMDGSMRDYMKLKPEEAIEAQKQLIEKVRDVDGTFISLWHNDTIREGSEWQKVYIEMAKEAGRRE